MDVRPPRGEGSKCGQGTHLPAWRVINSGWTAPWDNNVMKPLRGLHRGFSYLSGIPGGYQLPSAATASSIVMPGFTAGEYSMETRYQSAATGLVKLLEDW